MAGLWSRAFGGPRTPLEESLQRITDQETLDASADLFDSIVAASHNFEDRKVIMGHLRQCLSEGSGLRWRRILGGLLVVEQLLQKGDRTLFAEAAAGLHFDLGMRLGFLSEFEYTVDLRVQAMVRTKASALRAVFVAKLESAGMEVLETAEAPESSGKSLGSLSEVESIVDLPVQEKVHAKAAAFRDAFVAKFESASTPAPTPLEDNLRRITDRETLDASADVLDDILAASHNADDRKVIMGHLRQCLGEDSGHRWRRILGGLLVVEQLLQKGDRTLFAEAAGGLHFDLGMRLGFLSEFEYTVDLRVQKMVRTKASALREAFVVRLESAGTAAFDSTEDTRRVARSQRRGRSRSSSRSSRSSSRSSRSSSGSSRSSSCCSTRSRRRNAEKRPQPISSKKTASDSEASTASSNKAQTPTVFVDLLDF
jgi:hypothetical protein